MPDKATERQEAEAEYWRQDLNPDYMEGQNRGMEGQHPEKAEGVRTAHSIKDLHNRMEGYNDTDLQAIPIMPVGARLEQGATYIDLREDNPQEFSARGDMETGPDNWYVPKSEVDYQLWNRLIGVETPERLADTGE